MRDGDDGEHQRVVDALHEFRRRHEAASANEAMFRPSVDSLFEDEEREDTLAPELLTLKAKFPVALALPVILPWKGDVEIQENAHSPKTLLGYHYRFNAQASRGWSGKNRLIRSDQAPYICTAWALAVDKSELSSLARPGCSLPEACPSLSPFSLA